MQSAVTRRQLIERGAALGVLTFLGPVHSAAAAALDHWSYVDDRGKRLVLGERPTRIACLTSTVGAALWASGLRPVAAADDGEGINQAVGMSYTHTRKIPDVAGNLNIEALAAARPDLLVDAVQPDGTLQTVSGLPKLTDIAPVVGLSTYGAVERIVASAERLTTAVGTPLTDRAAKKRYDAALASLRSATTANPSLRVAFVFDAGPQLGLMNPVTWPVLKTVRRLGLHLVPVPNTKANQYSEGISWERAPSIPADLVVWAVADPLPKNPAWKQIPAVKAGQLWKPQIPSWYAYSYGNYADLFANLAVHVRHARAGVGPR